MQKWILLTVFLVATGVVSLGMNLRTPELSPGQRAAQMIHDGQYAQAVPLLEQLAIENKNDPQISNTLRQNIAYCKAHLPAESSFAAPAIALTATPAPAAPAAPAATTPAAGSAAAPIIDPTTGVARVPHPKAATGAALAMTIKELGNFPFDPVTDVTVPTDVLALDGVKITLNGFITPFQEADVITEFALTPSLAGCCFGQPAGVEHTIICHAAADRKVEFSTDEVIVTGRLIVKPLRENDYTHTVFQIEVESVKPAH